MLQVCPAPNPDWLGVDITVVKTIENHPKHSYVSWPVGVGAAAYLEMMNIN